MMPSRTLRTPSCAALALMSLAMLIVPSFALSQERREVPEPRAFGEARPGQVVDVTAFVESFKDAWSRQDADALVALHAEDVEWINAYARMFQGAEPLAVFLEQRLFPSFAPEVSRQEAANMRMVSTRYLGDVAIVHMYTDGARGPSRNEGEELRRTHIHLVLADESDGWKIVHSVIMDAR